MKILSLMKIEARLLAKYSCLAALVLTSNMVSLGNMITNNFKESEPKVISIEVENKQEKKENILYLDGKSWREGDRYFHVTSTNDTIVSFASKKIAEKEALLMKAKVNPIRGIQEIVYDTADPSFGLVPYRHGNDTLPLTQDYSIKNRANKIIQLEAEIAADTTDQVSASASGWSCGTYATQDATINKFGVYDIENSTLYSPPGDWPLDFSYNDQGEIPAYRATTMTTSGVPHAICCAFIGAENIEDNDVTVFDQWYFWEPQTDERIFPGNFSMDPDSHANIDWYGYTYSVSWDMWLYATRNTIDFDLQNGVATITYQSPDLTIFWTPFDQVLYPADSTHEFPADTSVLANGEPTDLYNAMSFSHSDTSTEGSDPDSCNHYTFTVTRTWDGVVGDYNSSNTPAATHDQYINSEDTEVPVRDSNGTWTDNSGLVSIVYDTVSTQGTDPNQCNYYTYTETPRETAIDPCDNESIYTGEPVYFSDTEPPVRDDDGVWTDNSGVVNVVYDTISTQGTDPTQCDFYNYSKTPTETASDPCNNLATYTGDPIFFSDTEGAYVSTTPFPVGDTLYRTDMSANHEPTEEEWADFADNQATGHLQRDFYDEIVFEDNLNRLWKIEQYADDPCGNDPQDYFEYYVNIPKTVGINQNLESMTSVYPNPTTESIIISYRSQMEQNIKVVLYNMNGQKTEDYDYHIYTGDNEIELSMTKQKPGLYLLKLEADLGLKHVEKVIKKTF